MFSSLVRWSRAALLGLVLLPVAASGGEARDNLLNSLPSDPAFCLTVQDLRGKWQQLEKSPFWANFKGSRLHGHLAGMEWVRKFEEADGHLQVHLQTNLAQVRDDLLGDALLFAYWPATAQSADRVLFLSSARDRALATRLNERLMDLQLQSGELRSATPVQHRGVTFHRCLEQEKESCRAVVEGLIVIASDEELMKQWLDTRSEGKPSCTLAKQFQDLAVAEDLAVLYVNPRPFDGPLADKVAAAPESEAPFLRSLQAHWQHVSSAALALDVKEAVDLRLVVRSDVDRLPAASRNFLRQADQPSKLWSLVPDASLFAVSSSIDPVALMDVLLEAMPADERGKKSEEMNRATLALFGMQFKEDLLQQLGPDWVFYVAPAPGSEAFPDFVFAMTLKPNKELAETEEAFRYVLNTTAGLLATARTNEGKPTVMKRTKQNGMTIFQLFSEPDWNGPWQPAAAIANGRLFLANSPEALLRAQSRAATPGQVKTTHGVPLARFSGQGLSAFLSDKQRRAGLVTLLSQAQQRPAAEIEEKIESLLTVLEPLGSVELTQQTAPGRLTLWLRMQPRHPLK